MLLATDWQMLGSFADWTTAGVALLAFLVAAVAAKFTAQTNRAQQETLELQRKQYAESRDEIERSQAEKVSFWETDDNFRGFAIVNASDSPIFDVEILIQPGGRGGPDADRNLPVAERLRTLLPTGKDPEFVSTIPSVKEAGHDLPLYLVLLFSDASGRWWQRHYLGNLTKARA